MAMEKQWMQLLDAQNLVGVSGILLRPQVAKSLLFSVREF